MNKSKITESEWYIMKVLWFKSPLTFKEIMPLLPSDIEWKENTVKTLLSRLVNKDVLNYKKEGRFFKYYPTVSEEACRQVESQHFVEKVFDGVAKSMLVSFIKSEELTHGDIEELKKLLDDKLKGESDD